MVGITVHMLHTAKLWRAAAAGGQLQAVALLLSLLPLLALGLANALGVLLYYRW